MKTYEERKRQLEEELGVVFCENGKYAEMSMDLADYEHRVMPVPDTIHFTYFDGDMEVLRAAVAAVDEEWVQYFQAQDRVFCGFDGDRIASFCIVEEDADCLLSDGVSKIGSIGCVGTVPEYRRQGIGLYMVALATGQLKEHGCDKGYIHYTHLEHWYSKLGYRTFARFSKL